MVPEKIRLALLQNRVFEEKTKNLSKILFQIKEAARQGAQIISTSELFLSPYFCQIKDPSFFEWAEILPNRETEKLAAACAEHHVVLVSSHFEKAGDLYFNTVLVFDADGSLLGKYRKIHIPDDPQNYYGERDYFSPGDLGYPVFKTHYATIGVQVCWDQWFPEGARVQALNGARIIFYPTAIGFQDNQPQAAAREEREAWQTIQRGHAIANGVYVAAINRVGKEQHLNFWGSSFVAGPLGTVLKQAGSQDEEIVLVDCDMEHMDEVRKDWPFLENCQ